MISTTTMICRRICQNRRWMRPYHSFSSPRSTPPLLGLYSGSFRVVDASCSCLRFSRVFGSGSLDNGAADNHFPTAIDYISLLQEDEFHRLANTTIHDLQEKFEEYGDIVQIDGFDVDYGNEVLTLKLGSFGTYVLNKQTPNRQIWLSSPVSGPSRFDWDRDSQSWVYRRTKAKLLELLEIELEKLCSEPISLS